MRGVMLTGNEMTILSVLLLALAPGATPLKAVRNPDLTTALAYQHELANTFDDRDAPYTVRVYQVITSINECGGPISSCPDVDLYVAVSEFDLASEPALYRLPRAKGWEFVRWTSTCQATPDEPRVGFAVRTSLPDVGYMDPDEVTKWRPNEYEVCVSPRSAAYSTKQHNSGLQPPAGAPSSGATRQSGRQRAGRG